jgi:hypothetical protein
MKSVFFHAAILIPIEFGLLHATPLGPMLTGAFTDMFAGMGFEWAAGGVSVAGDTLHMAL